MTRAFCLVLTLLVAVSLSAPLWAEGEQMAVAVNLLEGLRDGRLIAEFHGAGGSSVSGILGNREPGPVMVQIPSGTQFQAQLPGRQGMSTLGSLKVPLQPGQLASVNIPTACTALGLPEPTAEDVMIPRPCPDARLARLAAALDARPVPQAAAQVAVWALSDNPPLMLVQPYLNDQAPGFDLAAYAARRELVQQAAALLGAAGLEPRQFRMFMGMR